MGNRYVVEDDSFAREDVFAMNVRVQISESEILSMTLRTMKIYQVKLI